jgi:hypothetical protein
MQESGFTMFIHSAFIAALLYVIMRFVLGQRAVVAEDRSVLLGALALVYMVLFGHGAPTTSVNPHLF